MSDSAELRRLVEIILATTAPGPAAAALASWPAVRPILAELRGEALREAAAFFQGSRWAAAQALEAALSTFRAQTWPRYRDRPTALCDAQGLNRVLLRLVVLGQRAASADRLHRQLSAQQRNSAEAVVWR